MQSYLENQATVYFKEAHCRELPSPFQDFVQDLASLAITEPQQGIEQ